MDDKTELWRVGEENTGGGCNIYCGKLRVAHTAEISTPNAGALGCEPITSEQARANAHRIVNAVNAADQQSTAGSR